MATRPTLRTIDGGDCATVNTLETPGVTSPSNRKVIVVNFVFSETGAESQVPIVTFGRGHTPASQGCNFLFVLVGTKDEVLAEFGIWDPRVQISHEKPQIGFVVAQQATYAARFPFSANAKEVRLLGSQREQLNVIPLTSAVRTFCLKHPSESDCKELVK